MEPDAAEETSRLAAALESAPGTDEAISFEGMMAVAEGRDPISQLMESSRKLDRHGLLDRIEGLGWRLYGITERARRTAAASPSEELVNNLIGAAMAVAWTLVERETLEFRPDRRVAEHDAHALAVAVDAYLAEIDARAALAALRTTKEGK